MNTQSEEIEINLVELFFVIKKRIIAIILAALVLGIGTGMYCKYMVTPLYQSTAKLYILTKTTSVTSFADIQLGSVLTLDYMELVYSRPVVEKVIKNQKLDETYETLLNKVNVENPSDTRILNIVVTYEEPHTAKAVADEFAKVSQKSISSIMKTDEPSIVETGYVNKNKVSPTTTRNAAIAAIIGALLAAGIIVVIHLMNDTIRSSDDVEKYLGINVLSSIPKSKDEETRRGKRKRNSQKKEGASS